jgi:FKBP-type peptidyl-prolyl cis-trans isomerase SlyD
MEISKNKVVTLSYVLKLNDSQGEIVETVTKDQPFVHMFGTGNLLESFEQKLNGKKTGELFEFALTCDEAYGNVNVNAVVNLPISTFIVDGKVDYNLLQIGNEIPMQNQDGQPLYGLVVSIDNQTVRMDFNHPLAGKNLHFNGEVINVREATPEELSHGHAHGVGGHAH